MLKKISSVLWLFVTVFLLASCMAEPRRYVIGVSQCSRDSWREKLESELIQATYFNEDVKLVICSADDDETQQCRQIDSLLNIGVDLLVVSPQKMGSKLSEPIARATEKKIPVILFDRKSDVKDYTAFMGADNYMIGKMLGEYAASRLGGRGNIVEIAGEHGSSPAEERHRGFVDAMKHHPEMKMIGYEEGDWKLPSGEAAMENILLRLEKENPDFTIDLVFGGNDRMALGARKAIERYNMTHSSSRSQNNHPVIYLGVDALPTAGGGMEKVRDGLLTASAIYPTHGDQLIELALNIVKGESYEKSIDMETSLVTSDNANVLLMQYKEVANQDKYIQKMHARVNNILSMLNLQRLMLGFIIVVVICVSLMFVVTRRAYILKNRLYDELSAKNDELNREKGIVERQRDELEEKRDQLLDATTDDEEVDEENANMYQSPESEVPKNEFMDRFLECLDRHVSDSDLSVEAISQELGLSRVQLYRKVKAVAGRTPVEIIREERLKRARVLLADSSLSVSEVAYRVGFSAPSYFAKCYKEYYGKSPSGKQK